MTKETRQLLLNYDFKYTQQEVLCKTFKDFRVVVDTIDNKILISVKSTTSHDTGSLVTITPTGLVSEADLVWPIVYAICLTVERKQQYAATQRKHNV
jgi:hypothetical protein